MAPVAVGKWLSVSSVSSQSEARDPGSRANEKPGQMTPTGDQFMFDTPTVHISLKCVKIFIWSVNLTLPII